MSLLPGISNPYLAAFGSGLIYGFAFCTAACLPFVTGYIAGVGAGFRRGIAITLTYNAGRIAAYAVIGVAVAALSGLSRLLLSEETLLTFQQYSSIAFGIVTIVIGASIIMKSRSHTCENIQTNSGVSSFDKPPARFDIRAFLLGLSRGLVLCPPLIALLLYSAVFASPIDGLVIAVLFGLGTALSPLLLLGGATGWLLSKAPLFRKWISLIGVGILIIFGVGTMVASVMAKYP